MNIFRKTAELEVLTLEDLRAPLEYATSAAQHRVELVELRIRELETEITVRYEELVEQRCILAAETAALQILSGPTPAMKPAPFKENWLRGENAEMEDQ